MPRIRTRLNHTATLLVIGCFLLPVFQGCSVFLASQQPSKKDLSVLERGTPRAVVREELGWPIAVDEAEETHGCHETYAFKQGYAGASKAGRAGFHLIADIFTIGLWELVATPTELYFSGTDVKLEVLYDESERVDSVCVYTGADAVSADSIISTDEMKRRTSESPSQP